MVAIDNTTLALLLHPKAKPPNDPATKLPLTKAQERIEHLITDLDAESERIIIPTPVLSEFLILAAKDGQLYLEKIQAARTLLIKPFDEEALIDKLEILGLVSRDVVDETDYLPEGVD